MINNVEQTGKDEFTVHSDTRDMLAFLLYNLKPTGPAFKTIKKGKKDQFGSTDYTCKLTSKDVADIFVRYALLD